MLWQYGRWPFPLLALLIICSLIQQHPTADWKGNSIYTVEQEPLPRALGASHARSTRSGCLAAQSLTYQRDASDQRQQELIFVVMPQNRYVSLSGVFRPDLDSARAKAWLHSRMYPQGRGGMPLSGCVSPRVQLTPKRLQGNLSHATLILSKF